MYEGIEQLCTEIESLPWEDQEFLLIIACGALGGRIMAHEYSLEGIATKLKNLQGDGAEKP